MKKKTKKLKTNPTMIKRYVCQCLNVSIETLPSPVTDSSRDQLFNQIETSSLSEISKRDFLKNKFNELCLEINTNNYIDLTAIKYPEFFNLNLVIIKILFYILILF